MGVARLHLRLICRAKKTDGVKGSTMFPFYAG